MHQVAFFQFYRIWNIWYKKGVYLVSYENHSLNISLASLTVGSSEGGPCWGQGVWPCVGGGCPGGLGEEGPGQTKCPEDLGHVWEGPPGPEQVERGRQVPPQETQRCKCTGGPKKHKGDKIRRRSFPYMYAYKSFDIQWQLLKNKAGYSVDKKCCSTKF